MSIQLKLDCVGQTAAKILLELVVTNNGPTDSHRWRRMGIEVGGPLLRRREFQPQMSEMNADVREDEGGES